MKRQSILIAACIFAAVSLGGNIWLLMQRKDKTAEPGPAVQTTPHDASVGPALRPVAMDFSDTAFADGSWKLSDGTEPVITGGTFNKHVGGNLIEVWASDDGAKKPADESDSTVSFDKPFKWEDVPLAGEIKTSDSPDPPVQVLNHRRKLPLNPESHDSAPVPVRGIPPLQFWQGNRSLEVPSYLNLPMSDPNDVRRKGLIAIPPFTPK